MARYPAFCRFCLILQLIIYPSLQTLLLAQANSVSIGVDQLKESAVLWLKGNGSQGFLLPAVSTTADVLTSDIEPGMMVYQSTGNSGIYWFDGTEWHRVENAAATGGGENSYDLDIEGNDLILTENGSTVSTVKIASGSSVDDGQVLTWDGANGRWEAAAVEMLHGFPVQDPDGVAGDKVLIWDGTGWVLNDLTGPSTLEMLSNVSSATPLHNQVLRFNDTAGEWQGSEENTFSGSFNDLADVPVNLDTDATDDFSGNYLDLVNKPGAADIAYTDNHNLPATNVQDAIDVLAGSQVVNTDEQQLSYDPASQNLSLTNGGSVTLDVNDQDADITNELQSLTLTGSNLSITDDPVNTSGIDLSSFNTDDQTAAEVSYDPAVSGLNATDVKNAIDELAASPDSDHQDLTYDAATQTLSLTNGGSVILDINDGDASAVNEIQHITFSSTTSALSLTEPGQPDQTVDLSSLLDNSDNQDLSFSGATGTTTGSETFNLDISGGTGVVFKEGANITITQTGGTELMIEAVSGLTTVATDGTTITGDGRTSNPLGIPSGAITSSEIANGTIIDDDIASVSPEKLIQAGANPGEVLKWNGSQWAPRVISTDGTTITGDGDAAPFSVGVIASVNLATGSVTAEKINADVAGNGLIKGPTGELAVDGSVVALDADLGTIAAQDSNAVNITGGKLDNVSITNGNFSGNGAGLTDVNAMIIAGLPVDPNIGSPAVDDVLKWDGNQWTAAEDATDTGGLLSDRRAKKEIKSLTYGLSHILNLKPVSYQYKKGDSRTRLGLIAQEVQPVVPEVVKNMDEEYLGITYIDLMAVVIKAIQEQQKIIDQQQKEIDLLKAKIFKSEEDATSSYDHLRYQIDILKAQVEQLSNVLNVEAKNDRE